MAETSLRRTLGLLAFLGVLFAGDRLGAASLRLLVGFGNEPIAQMYSDRAKADVVLLGNSRAYHHLAPADVFRGLSVPAVNLSTPGASMETVEALFLDYVDRYGPPEMVILELSCLTIGRNAALMLRGFARESTRVAALLKSVSPTAYYAGRFSALFELNNYFTLNAVHKIVADLPDVTLSGQMSEAAADAAAAVPGGYFRANAEQVAALRRISNFSRDRGIDLRMIITPVLPGFADVNGFDAWRQAALDAASAFVWDYSSRMDFGPEFFNDPVHLNGRGVALLSQQLERDGVFSLGTRPTIAP